MCSIAIDRRGEQETRDLQQRAFLEQVTAQALALVVKEKGGPRGRKKDPHPGCTQLPMEHARALCLHVTLRKDRKEKKELRTVTRDTKEQLKQNGFPNNTENEFFLDSNQWWILCALTTVKVNFQ